MTKISTLHKNWLKDSAYKEAYGSLSTEFELAQKLLEVRVKSGISQREFAQKMGTGKPPMSESICRSRSLLSLMVLWFSKNLGKQCRTE